MVEQNCSGSALNTQEEQKIAKMLAESGAPSVSIAIVENGRLVYAKAFGKASLAHNRGLELVSRRAAELQASSLALPKLASSH